jgi:hypothetical protein
MAEKRQFLANSNYSRSINQQQQKGRNHFMENVLRSSVNTNSRQKATSNPISKEFISCNGVIQEFQDSFKRIQNARETSQGGSNEIFGYYLN